MTAARSELSIRATRRELSGPCALQGLLFCLAGGGQAGLSALNATGSRFSWRLRCDTVRSGRGCRPTLNGMRSHATSTQAQAPSDPDDLARQLGELVSQVFDAKLSESRPQQGHGLTAYQHRQSADRDSAATATLHQHVPRGTAGIMGLVSP